MKRLLHVITLYLLISHCPAKAGMLEELSKYLELTSQQHQKVERIFKVESSQLLQLKKSDLSASEKNRSSILFNSRAILTLKRY